jgi:hypothetical protein
MIRIPKVGFIVNIDYFAPAIECYAPFDPPPADWPAAGFFSG